MDNLSFEMLKYVTFIYGLAAFFYITYWIFKKQVLGKLATGVTYIAVLGNVAGFGLRWYETYQQGVGHAPLSNTYESLIFFAMTIALVYLFIEFRYQKKIIGMFALPLSFFALLFAATQADGKITPLVPALKSNWLVAHVITCFFGYAGFAIAFGLGLLYFLKKALSSGEEEASSDSNEKGFLAALDYATIDELTYQMVMFGFLFLTAGIMTGSVWANTAWGKYWSWDPKEVWSLITWLYYAAFLHFRLMKGWSGARLAALSILGFGVVLFTYFGVNTLLSGLHSYAK